MYKLYPFQKEAVDLCVEKYVKEGRLRTALFWEMRLGKTIVSLQVCKNLGFKRVLIVCPKTITVNWEEQCEIFGLPYIKIFSRENKLTLSDCGRTNSWDPIYAISNPEWIQSRKPELHFGSNWDCIIYDESHGLCNPKTATSKFFLKKYREIQNKLVLSGTESPNSPIDVFNQMVFLDDVFCGYSDYWKFKNNFCTATGSYNQFITIKQENLHTFQKEKDAMSLKLKRSQVNVGSKKHYITLTTEMEPKYRKVYKKMETDWYLNELQTSYKVVVNNYLHQMCGGFLPEGNFESNHKLKAVKNLLTGELKGKKVVIWCSYREEQKQLCDYLIKHTSTQHSKINGDVSHEMRHARITSFNKAPWAQSLICTYGTVDQGTDFSVADYAIYYSNSYSRVHRPQSEDRIINIKKKVPVLYIDLITPDSLDIDIKNVLQMKQAINETFPSLVQKAFIKRLNK